MAENKSKYCIKCGTENPSDAINCTNCGEKFPEPAKTDNRKMSGFAVAGFIMSILAWLLDFNSAIYDIDLILGIIFCFIGIHYTKNGAQKGRGFAVFGIIAYLIIFVLAIYGASIAANIEY